MNDHRDGLRRWARGLYPLEAGVELLRRSSNGRFASPGCPWIRQARIQAGGGSMLTR